MSKLFTDQNFQSEVIDASVHHPVLVDFFAGWCGPCMMQGPIIDELATEMEDKVIIGKVDVEQFPQLSAQYRVMSIPLLLIFKNKVVVEQFLGTQSKEALRTALEKYV